MRYQVAVIGGGAAGLAAAVTAARLGFETALVEAQDRVGRKLLSTGNGRCNLTNRQAGDLSRYHGDTEKAAPVLNRMPPEKILDFFKGLGLPCRELAQGRLYPYSLQAASVLDTLCLALKDTGVSVRCGFFVSQLKRVGGFFRLMEKEGQTLEADRVILCTGGKAAPALGGNGSGLELAQALGHSLVPVKPGLTGMLCSPKEARPLKGARNPARAALLRGEERVASSEGEAQFTERGLSGICIQELSRWVEGPAERYTLSLDLLSDWRLEEVVSHLRQRRESRSLAGSELLCNCMNRLAARELARRVLPKGEMACRLSDSQLKALARGAKDFRFPIAGLQGWSGAQVMAGGIPLGEVALPSMESLICPGLYLAGEALNIDGDCGGFNLHWAWATGILAAEGACGKMMAG